MTPPKGATEILRERGQAGLGGEGPGPAGGRSREHDRPKPTTLAAVG